MYTQHTGRTPGASFAPNGGYYDEGGYPVEVYGMPYESSRKPADLYPPTQFDDGGASLWHAANRRQRFAKHSTPVSELHCDLLNVCARVPCPPP